MSNRSTPTLAIKGRTSDARIARLSRRIVKLQSRITYLIEQQDKLEDENIELRKRVAKWDAWEKAADAQVPR